MRRGLLLLCSTVILFASPTFADTYTLIRSWPVSGRAIAVSADAVYVVGSSVQKFSLDGASLGGWSSQGTAIATDSQGNLYVADHSMIRKYDPDGTPLAQFLTNLVVQFIAIDRGGHIAIAGYEVFYEAQLIELDSAGLELSRLVTYDTDWRGLAASSDGFCTIQYYDGDSPPRVSVRCPGKVIGLIPTCLDKEMPAYSEPHGLAIGSGPSGDNCFVPDACDATVREYSARGNVAEWSIGTDPVNIAVDSSGNVYVLGGFGVQKFSPSSPTPTKSGTWGEIKTRWNHLR